MTFKEEWLVVDGFPTKFLTWGAWVEDFKGENVILMFTGNPGIVAFYQQFLHDLYADIKIPVWAVSHVGHELPPQDKKIDTKALYDLKQQVDHKAAIIKKFVPSNCKMYIIGHSMGAKVIVELLKMPEFENNIEKCYMLFPTIERIGDTPNAQFIKPMVRYFGSVLVFLSWVFTLLPNFIQCYLLNGTFRLAYGNSDDCTVQGGIQLIKPDVLKNVFHLVKDELIKIKELDTEILNSQKHKLKFYFGTSDGWSPLEYCANLKEKVPEVDAIICTEGMRHAFAITSGNIMAGMISNWIRESKKTAIN